MLTLCKLRNKIEALEKRLLEGAENDEHSSMSARDMQTPIRSAVRLLFSPIFESQTKVPGNLLWEPGSDFEVNAWRR